jgi:hypothetical protein
VDVATSILSIILHRVERILKDPESVRVISVSLPTFGRRIKEIPVFLPVPQRKEKKRLPKTKS